MHQGLASHTAVVTVQEHLAGLCHFSQDLLHSLATTLLCHIRTASRTLHHHDERHRVPYTAMMQSTQESII